MTNNHSPLIYLFPLLTTLFWGITFNVSVIAVSYFSPLMTAAFRFLIAGVIFLPILLWQGKPIIAIIKQNWRVHLAMALTGVVGFNLFFFMGMKHTTPLNGALIMATTPLVAALISRIFIKENLDTAHKIGTIISFVGILILLLAGSRKLGHINQGDLYMMGSCISLAFYGVIGKKYQKNSTPIVTAGVTTIIGALIFGAIAFSSETFPQISSAPVSALLSLLFMGVFGSVLAYIFWNYSFKHIGVANTTLFFHFVPVFTVLVSLLFHQTVTLIQLGAGVIVMLGVLVATKVIKLK